MPPLLILSPPFPPPRCQKQPWFLTALPLYLDPTEQEPSALKLLVQDLLKNASECSDIATCALPKPATAVHVGPDQLEEGNKGEEGADTGDNGSEDPKQRTVVCRHWNHRNPEPTAWFVVKLC